MSKTIRSVDEIERDLAELNEAMSLLLQRSGVLSRELRAAKSARFIKANGITRGNVQLSRGDGIPYFGIITAFGEWMVATRCTKDWCEWNGLLQRTSDVMRGLMDHNACGEYEDVPE